MNMRKYILLSLSLAALVSCTREKVLTADFNLSAADQSLFQITSIGDTDLSKGLPDDCYIPTEEGVTKATSVTANVLLADLLEYGNQSKVLEIAGVYSSFDSTDGYEEIKLSGKVLLPKNRKPKRYIVSCHWTIGSNAEAPSNCFPIEGVLCSLGYALICPDYCGYGVTADRIHPYRMLDQTAFDVWMMYLAVRKMLANTEYAPEFDDIYIMGYSQGGATAMGFDWFLETNGFDQSDMIPEFKTTVRCVFAGGGPYDVRETYNNFITTNHASICCAVPMVIQGMIKGNNLDIDPREILEPWLYEKMDEWINSKKYSTAQMNSLIGTTTTSDLLTDMGMDPTSEPVARLYQAMSENSLLSYNWTPKAPVYMIHSIDDDTVPFINAAKARSKWENGNITYNFGHYGTHIATALRFVSSVKSYLENAQKENSDN